MVTPVVDDSPFSSRIHLENPKDHYFPNTIKHNLNMHGVCLLKIKSTTPLLQYIDIPLLHTKKKTFYFEFVYIEILHIFSLCARKIFDIMMYICKI